MLFLGRRDAYSRLAAALHGAGGPPRVVTHIDARGLRRRGACDRVVLQLGALPDGDLREIVRALRQRDVRVNVVPRRLDDVATGLIVDEICGRTFRGAGLSRTSRATKRAVDLCCTSVMLIAVAPIMVAIALAIRLDSRGPALFRQTRVGRDGRLFEILKFRTMEAGADERRAQLRVEGGTEGLFKLAADPRVTRVGRLLRRTSLDEMPQLLNVLMGSMSLVGPRPLVLDEDAQIIGADRLRLHMSPGMTGVWQVLGGGRVPLHEMVKLDLQYLAGWSPWVDVRIMLRTVPHMIGRRGM